MNERGEPVPDLRVYAQERDDDQRPRLLLSNPASIWGRAGLHTGDLIATFNGVPLRASADFRRLARALRIGDTARLELTRPDGPRTVTVVVTGFERPVVRVEAISAVTARQRLVREGWLASAGSRAAQLTGVVPGGVGQLSGDVSRWRRCVLSATGE